MQNVTCALYHHIGPVGVFEDGLNIATQPDRFQKQIAWMSKNFDIISLDQMLSGDLPKRPLLLTFDDAFQSVFDMARDVLAPQNIPSVYFINPLLLEQGEISLDSTLAWAANTAGIEPVCKLLDLPLRTSIHEIVVFDMAKYTSRQRQAIRDSLLETFGPPDLSERAPLMTITNLRDLATLGVEIGNHTNTHVSCRSLAPDEYEHEIIASKQRLEALSGQRVRSFAVPYGLDADLTDPLLDILRTSGHEAIFLVQRRSNRWRPAPDVWYRTSLHNEAESQLTGHMVYKPLLRSLKHKLMR